VDVLIGGSDWDWFIGKTNGSAGVKDRVIDSVIGERISDIEFDLL